MITIYTKQNCMPCKMTKKKLDELAIRYEQIDVTFDNGRLDWLSSLGFKSLPVVETPNKMFSGFRPDELTKLKEEK